MMISNGLFTSESVSEGHPDKLADQISDAILDRFLELDSHAKVACETLVADGFVVVTGEFKTNEAIFKQIESETESLVRSALADVGYDDAETGINPKTCQILVRFNHQSPDISQGVELANGEIGAGDQGLMFGYATNETAEHLPLTLVLAHRLVKRQAEMRKSGQLPWLKPDAKSQVTVRYKNGQPVEVTAVVLSTQHAAGIPVDEMREAVRQYIIDPVLDGYPLANDLQILINPTGQFVMGGPKGDTGLTGRKIIVDTYGGAVPHGGGAFSGKDPTKVDRSAAYAARFLANQVVARGWAQRCLIQLSYAIGMAQPVSFAVETFGTGTLSSEQIAKALSNQFDLTPAGIIKKLDLLRPIYRQTATYGHFGRTDLTLPWETACLPTREQRQGLYQQEIERLEGNLREWQPYRQITQAAKSRQLGSLTPKQYQTLRKGFQGQLAQRFGSPSWFTDYTWWCVRGRVVDDALSRDGLSVRGRAYARPHRYVLHKRGLERLIELENKIRHGKQRQKRKQSQT